MSGSRMLPAGLLYLHPLLQPMIAGQGFTPHYPSVIPPPMLASQSSPT